ncbi:MAG: hypothetical protein KF764_24515 [Labilithrix sp.]|nr:hypothetical protein [Labilithrix sp.]MBX3221197.1 hypothetical protein [Labilithrix sp.]
MQPSHDRADTNPVTCFVEVALPMPVSHAWVAYACRAAGVAKPRWNPAARVWTTSAKGESGLAETISITNGNGPNSVRVRADWLAPETSPRETATTRRLVTAFVTGMQWAVRRRASS